MTEAQRKRLYFPSWRRAFEACWREEQGVVRPDGPESDYTRRTWAVAGQLARAAVRRITPEDLRHACNALALQRAREYRSRMPEGHGLLDLRPEGVSSAALDALALDLVLCWFRLLRDETDLDASMGWTHPENLERRRMEHHIETRCQPGYAARLCADLFGTSDWYSLDWEAFRDLYCLLRQRPNAWRRAAPAPRPEPVGAVECPF